MVFTLPFLSLKPIPIIVIGRHQHFLCLTVKFSSLLDDVEGHCPMLSGENMQKKRRRTKRKRYFGREDESFYCLWWPTQRLCSVSLLQHLLVL